MRKYFDRICEFDLIRFGVHLGRSTAVVAARGTESSPFSLARLLPIPLYSQFAVMDPPWTVVLRIQTSPCSIASTH